MGGDGQGHSERCRLRVFISYRRGDSDIDAGAICDAFVDRLGERCVFFDVDQEPGDFRNNIKEYIKRADVLVSVIGKRWVELRKPPVGETDGEDGVVWHEDDNVRWELQLALERKIELVPVFVDDVDDIPDATELPEELHPLKRWSGYRLVSRTLGRPNYRQGLGHICDMVELAVRRRRDRDIRDRVQELIKMARVQREERMSEAVRVSLERASVAVEEIEDEMIKEEVLEELEPELETLLEHDRGLLGDVRRTLARSRDLAAAGQAGEARRTLVSAAEVAHRIADEQLRREASSQVEELERTDIGGEGRFRELVEQARRQARVRQLEEASATVRIAGEAARSIETEPARAEALVEAEALSDEVRAVAEAAARGDFAAATELAGARGTVRGQNASAGKEPGEPDHAGNAGGKSVWYRWTAPEDGAAMIDTFGSDFDTVLAVYRGSDLASLEPVAANDDSDGLQSRVRFPVVAGEEYRIAVDGYGGASGAVVLNWETLGPVPNDRFDSAENLTGAEGTTTGQNASAGKEPGEPDHAGNAGGKSVWYRWTAPEDGAAMIDTFGSDFDTVLAVYRGSDLASLEPVAANDDSDGLQSRVRFPVVAGEEYRIAVDGYGGASGAVVLNWKTGRAIPIADLVRSSGLQFTELGGGAVAVPFAGERTDRVVVTGKELEHGIALFIVALPEFSGFGMKAFLKTMLGLSYSLDYVKALPQADGCYVLAVEADPELLTPSVCEGLIRGLAALGDVKNEADLISGAWEKRREECGTMQSRYISIDAEQARSQVEAMMSAASPPIQMSWHVTSRVVSFIATVEDLRPGRNKDKLSDLLKLNSSNDIVKVGLDSKGRVKLLYEVPGVTPDLVERAGARLAGLSLAVRAVLG